MFVQPIDYFLLVWFVLAGASTAYVAWDQFRGNPEPAVMKWGFILVTLYLGPVGLLLYVLADKEPRPGTHEEFTSPLWKQGIGSTIHCVAGDATGIILAAAVTALLGLPMWVDIIVEYVAGFAFGLFIFQALFMKNMMGGSYWENVRKSFIPEFISMNAMMAGMAPVMATLMMGRDMRAMWPGEFLFWGVMALGILAGFALAYPFNIWLVAKGLKHGLMTERAPNAVDSVPEPGEHSKHGATAKDAEPAGHAGPTSKPAEAADAHGHAQHAEGKAEEPAQPEHMQHEHGPAHGHAQSGIPVFAAIGRHPLHPMLVPLPIGLFVTAFLADLVYWLLAVPLAADIAFWLIAAGLAGGVIAALVGLADFFGSAQIRALYHARYHLAGNLALLAIAVGSMWWRYEAGAAAAVLPWGIMMSAAVVALLAFTGWHGGEMVFGHGVGMNPHDHGKARATPARSGAAHAGHNAEGGKHQGHAQQQGHGQHGGDLPPAFAPTRAQIAAMASFTTLLLAAGFAWPFMQVNMRLSAHDVGDVIMAPGMIMDFDTPGAAMRDMAAIDPRLVSYEARDDELGGRTLTPRIENGVKVFDLEASVIRWSILPGETVEAFAYNGQVPGPTLRVTEGDRVRINVTNKLPESTTVHWHGMILPNEMDGPAEITQKPIEPGESYSYEYTVGQHGTYFYHTHDHVDRQQSLGLYGALIIDPKNPADIIPADLEHTVQLQEWLKREWLTFPAMPMEGGMPNFFTINGKSFPATDTIKMKVGQTLKVRFVGSHTTAIHPMHIHGGPFEVAAVDGMTLADSARYLADTVNVGPGQRFDVLWTALRPGKWLVHCHIPHHTTNNNVEVKGGGGLMLVIEVSA
jgi:uncharacterized membrane protein/plastocyanin